MSSIIQFSLRGDTLARWTSFNPILADRELVLERDTGKFKIGNGVLHYLDLPYGGIVGPQGPIGPGLTVIGSVNTASISSSALNSGFPSAIRGNGVINEYDKHLWVLNTLTTTGGIWVDVGNIQGPKGDPGADSTVPGPVGPAMTVVATIATVGAFPQTSLGAARPGAVRGEGILAEDTKFIWFFDGALWVNAGNFTGIQGPQGAPGHNGTVDLFANAVSGTIDLAVADFFTITVTGPTTMNVINALPLPQVNRFILDVINGGSAVGAWFTGIKWEQGMSPALTTAGRDSFGFYSIDGGVTWVGTYRLDVK